MNRLAKPPARTGTEGRRPAPLAAPPNPRAVPRVLPVATGPGLGAHNDRWGPRPTGGPALIGEVERAGLRGRGGAAFPTATKLRTVAAAGRSIVVANGTEGEPVSAKDKALLAVSPHLVLDGAALAAETVSVGEAVICVDRAATVALESVRLALAERRRWGVDGVSLRMEATPSRYVTGEESALVHWLNGGEAKPVFVPPRVYERGVRGRPTLVNNVETLAHLALIARFGADWYRALGTPDDPGTALVTVTGDVSRPGVYELPMGISLARVLETAVGAEVMPAAILVGGYAGTWLPGETAANLKVDAASLSRVGARLACGAVTVLGPGTCGLIEVARVTRWLAGQSAGQCGPCLNGLPAIATAVDALAAGNRVSYWGDHLRRWLDMVDGRGACHHPDGTARFVRSALAVFESEIERHRRNGPCPRPSHARLPTPDLSGSWK